MTSGLSVDIANEFRVLKGEAELLAQALPQLQHEDSASAKAVRWIEIAGVAAAVEKLYSGCERVLLLIAKHVDGAPIDKTDAWHATLLNRMVNPFPNVRPAVLSEDCKATLDRFRSFRHRVRNNYGIDLDPDIVLERAGELLKALDTFKAEIDSFIGRLPPRDAPRAS